MSLFNDVEVHFLSRLKLTVQIQLALHPCDPFSINHPNMTGNSVEK